MLRDIIIIEVSKKKWERKKERVTVVNSSRGKRVPGPTKKEYII